MNRRNVLDTAMEKSPSWSRAHDWKSCRLLKGLEGSNPSFSARNRKPRRLILRGFSLSEYLISNAISVYSVSHRWKHITLSLRKKGKTLPPFLERNTGAAGLSEETAVQLLSVLNIVPSGLTPSACISLKRRVSTRIRRLMMYS